MIEFEVKDMSCGHCVGVVTQTVKLIDPNAKVEIDLGAKKVKIESDADRSSFAEALTTAGYPAV
ncbi:heavy-metal-associated domain-containing protein [Polaromonas eurypsychrophila]|uniref:Heavy metal-binding protein n=1 Tax=Polaromonas eurypsychrophila TaxID=1614635 RepID=A0A916SEK6_9BURK|nr:heavy-metal-associated domain-containing protein [Polaromonas eurypsychrophila]GGA96717.1 heavy metal-binding protein [Polaromonas eurypsychrophila]